MHNIETYYNAEDRLAHIEATDIGLADAYYDMVDSKECMAVVYGIDGLVLDVFSQDGRILDGTFDKEKFLSGGYVVMQTASRPCILTIRSGSCSLMWQKENSSRQKRC